MLLATGTHNWKPAVTPVVIESNAVPLAEMARNIASNVELRARVRRFAEGGGVGSEIAGPAAGGMQGAVENEGVSKELGDSNASGGDAEEAASGAGAEGAHSSDQSGGVSLVVARRSIAVGIIGGIGLFLQ